jgi:hypothetical protein
MDLWDVIGFALFLFFAIVINLDIDARGHTM